MRLRCFAVPLVFLTLLPQCGASNYVIKNPRSTHLKIQCSLYWMVKRFHVRSPSRSLRCWLDALMKVAIGRCIRFLKDVCSSSRSSRFLWRPATRTPHLLTRSRSGRLSIFGSAAVVRQHSRWFWSQRGTFRRGRACRYGSRRVSREKVLTGQFRDKHLAWKV
jgi:hypothetical protein